MNNLSQRKNLDELEKVWIVINQLLNYKLQSVNITRTQKYEETKFVDSIKKCIEYTIIIDILTSGDLFSKFSLLTLVDWNKTKTPKDKKFMDKKYFLE